MKKLIIASSIGTILEWYDFSLFAFFTPILAKLYFPHESTINALMLTYAIFAVGFLARPLGAILFGHFGDRLGRKQTLVFTIILMSLPTFLIGLLPTYAQIGICAPIFLIILRILQGLAVGGESTGATLFVLESHHFQNRGFMGAVLWSMVGIGMLLGSLVGTITLQFSNPEIFWRVPFLLGILTGFVGFFVRRNIPETLLFQTAQFNHKLKRFPLLDGVKKYQSELFIIMGLYVLSAMITYIIFIFMSGFVINIVGLPLKQVTIISTIAFLLSALLLPFGGYLSDRIGRKECLKFSAVFFVIFSYPLFNLIVNGDIYHYFWVQMLFMLIAVIFQGTITATVFELLPTEVRYSISGVGYNLSYSLFGGTAPFIASYLVKLSGNNAAPGIYLMFGGLIALIAVNKLPDTTSINLSGESLYSKSI